MNSWTHVVPFAQTLFHILEYYPYNGIFLNQIFLLLSKTMIINLEQGLDGRFAQKYFLLTIAQSLFLLL